MNEFFTLIALLFGSGAFASMALVRFGQGVAEIIGSIGGTTFSRTKAGAIARNRTKPVNPNSDEQSFVRSNFQQAVDMFRTLDFATITEWNEFAQTQSRQNALGESYVPSGKQLFMQAALNQLVIDSAATAPPDLSKLMANPNLPAVSPYTETLGVAAGSLPAEVVIDELELNNIESVGNPDALFVVQATTQLLPTMRKVDSYFRQIGAPTVATAGVIDVLAAYAARFPAVVAGATPGNVIHFRVRAINADSNMGGAWIYNTFVIPAA